MAGYEVGSAFLTIIPSAKDFGRNLGRETDGPLRDAGQRGGREFGQGVERGGRPSFVSAGKSMGGAFAGAFAAIGVTAAVGSVVSFLGDAIGSASDLAETVSKSNKIFGDNAGVIEKWAEGASKSVGLSKGAALDAAASFGNMFTQIGFASDTAADMSQDVVQLSADLGSFNNLPTEDVADRMSAAFRGEYDSIQALIPTINAATVEQRALADTGKASADELTAAEKAAAVLAIAHEQGATAAGDFAATSDGLANSNKILKADLENVKTEIGQALLPVATELFNAFKDTGVPILQEFATWVTENKEGIREFAFATVDATLQIVQGFLGLMEHMARMQEFWIMVGTNMVQTWFNVVENVINAAVNMFGWVPGVGDKLRTVQDGFGQLRADADVKFAGVRAAAEASTKGLDLAQQSVQGIRDSLAEIKDKTVTVKVVPNISDAFYQTLPGMGVRAPGRATGGPVRAGSPYVVGEREAELFVPNTNGTILNQKQLAALGVGSTGTRTIEVNAHNYGRPIQPSDLVQAGRSLAVLDPDW